MRSLITVVLLLAFSLANAQNFEGIVVYELHFKSKTDDYMAEHLLDYFGSTTTAYYKDGYYKEITNSKVNGLELWRHDENKIYTSEKRGADSLFVKSADAASSSGFDYEYSLAMDTILGRVCNQLWYSTNQFSKEYYFSEKYKTDAKLYASYRRGNRNEVMDIIQSIPLRINIHYPQFDVDIVAVKVEAKTLPLSTFDIPKHRVMVME